MEVGVGVETLIEMMASSVVGMFLVLVSTIRLMVIPAENWRKLLDVNANHLMSSVSDYVWEANHSWSVSTFLMGDWRKMMGVTCTDCGGTNDVFAL